MTALMLFYAGFSAPAFSQVVTDPYTLLTRGQPSPYDTAVAIQVKTYRTETLKMEQADKVINDLQISNNYLKQTLYQAELKSKQSEAVQAKIISEQGKQMAEDAKTKEDFKRQFDKLAKVANRPRGFFRSPALWGTIGAVLGGAAYHGIHTFILKH